MSTIDDKLIDNLTRCLQNPTSLLVFAIENVRFLQHYSPSESCYHRRNFDCCCCYCCVLPWCIVFFYASILATTPTCRIICESYYKCTTSSGTCAIPVIINNNIINNITNDQIGRSSITHNQCGRYGSFGDRP